MKEVFHKLSALGWLEWKVIFSSMAWLPWSAMSLRIYGFKRTRDAFLKHGSTAQASLTESEQMVLVLRIARAVNIAAFHGFYRANCLKRSLVISRQLAMRGLKHELVFAAAKEEDDFSAHAWVEHAGRVINDAPDVDERFGAFRQPVDWGR